MRASMQRARLSALNSHLLLSCALGLLAYLNGTLIHFTKWQTLSLWPVGPTRDAVLGTTLLVVSNRLRFLTVQGRAPGVDWDGEGVGLFLRAGLGLTTVAWLAMLGKLIDQARAYEESQEPGWRLSVNAVSVLAAVQVVCVLVLAGV